MVAFLVSAFLSTVQVAAQDPGQKYESLVVAPQYVYRDPVGDEDFQAKKDMGTQKREAIRVIGEGRTSAQNVLTGSASRTAAFDAYFNEYVFPSMAQATDATTSSVGLMRQEFVKYFLSSNTRPGGNRTYLIETLTVPMCRRLATGNFHPSVRMNAVYLAGLLNDREIERDVFPAPNKAAFALLLELLRSPDSPEFIVASAASALARIAEIEGVAQSGLDSAPLRGYANSVLNGQAPGQDNWQPGTDYWMRKRSVQTLGNLRDSSAIGILNQIASGASNPIQLRIDAADAVGRIGFAGAVSGTAAGETVMSLSHLAADVFSAESQGIRSTIQDLVAVNLLWGDRYIIDPGAGGPDGGNPNLPGGRQGGSGDAGRVAGGEAGGVGAGGAGVGEGAAAGGAGVGEGQSQGSQGSQGGQGAGGIPGNDPVKDKKMAWREFNLPNYHINLVRRRSKAYIYTINTVLEKIKKDNLVAGNERAVLDQTQTVLNNAMIDTDMGLRDLSGRSDRRTGPALPFGATEEVDNTSTTVKMMEMFEAHAKKVKEFLPPAEVAPGQPAAAQGTPPVSAPASGTGT